MTTFVLNCIDQNGALRQFLYDNISSALIDERGKYVIKPDTGTEGYAIAPQTSKDKPLGKTRDIRTLKISLGLSCNYECSYCNQRFQPDAVSTNPRDVQRFVEQLPSWFDGGKDGKGQGVRVEFWGGEPLVYWKTLKPLAEAVKERYPNVELAMITNGSLLTAEINQWLDDMGFSIGMSHDGEAYEARGADPLDDEEKRKWIYDLFNRLAPKGRMSINAMLHKGNSSRAAIQKFMQRKFGNVPIGEGSFIDAYSDDAVADSFTDTEELRSFAGSAWKEVREGKANNFSMVHEKTRDFIESVKTGRNAYSLGQKCGMDDPQNIAVDLTGNVLTCQNTSSSAISLNGEPHQIGHVSRLDKVKLTTSTHWANREGCVKCPVLQLCKGSCMFLEGKLWDVTCNSAYFDNVVFFAHAVGLITGCTLQSIEGDLPDERKVPFSDKPLKKVIPIKAI